MDKKLYCLFIRAISPVNCFWVKRTSVFWETLYSWGKQLAELGQLFCLCIKLANRVKAKVVRNDFELLSQHKWVSGGAPN